MYRIFRYVISTVIAEISKKKKEKLRKSYKWLKLDLIKSTKIKNSYLYEDKP